MFLAGMYFPTERMPPTMRQIGNFTPLGAALHAVRDSWMGMNRRRDTWGIMAGYALIAGALACRFFRWEQGEEKGIGDGADTGQQLRVDGAAVRLAPAAAAVPAAYRPAPPVFPLPEPDRGRFGITAGVAVAAGAWITWMVILHPGWTERPWLMGVFFVGLVAFIAVLTVRSPWFAFFTWLGFLMRSGS